MPRRATSACGGFLPNGWGYPQIIQDHPSHEWLWLSIETHGDLGVPPFGTDMAGRLAVRLVCGPQPWRRAGLERCAAHAQDAHVWTKVLVTCLDTNSLAMGSGLKRAEKTWEKTWPSITLRLLDHNIPPNWSENSVALRDVRMWAWFYAFAQFVLSLFADVWLYGSQNKGYQDAPLSGYICILYIIYYIIFITEEKWCVRFPSKCSHVRGSQASCIASNAEPDLCPGLNVGHYEVTLHQTWQWKIPHL
jgi:hypothetical protein